MPSFLSMCVPHALIRSFVGTNLLMMRYIIQVHVVCTCTCYQKLLVYSLLTVSIKDVDSK